jgi:hypothetical protein
VRLQSIRDHFPRLQSFRRGLRNEWPIYRTALLPRPLASFVASWECSTFTDDFCHYKAYKHTIHRQHSTTPSPHNVMKSRWHHTWWWKCSGSSVTDAVSPQP